MQKGIGLFYYIAFHGSCSYTGNNCCFFKCGRYSAEFVSLVYNGTYMGVYELCEQVRIGESRVDIPDSAIEAESGCLSVVQLRAVGADGAYVKNVLGSDGGVYINAVSNYATFVKTVQTVSDETVRREGDDELPDSSGEEGKKSAVPVIAIVLVIIVVGGIGMSMIAKKSKR